MTWTSGSWTHVWLGQPEPCDRGGDPWGCRENTGRGVSLGSGPRCIWLRGLAQCVSVSVPCCVPSCENDSCLTFLRTLRPGVSV